MGRRGDIGINVLFVFVLIIGFLLMVGLSVAVQLDKLNREQCEREHPDAWYISIFEGGPTCTRKSEITK